MELILNKTPYFMVVFIRFAAFVGMVPFFKNKNYSIALKTSFALLVSFLIFPSLETINWIIPETMAGLAVLIASELLIGVIIGLVLLILIFILELVGQLIGFQMAFSMARAVDSTSETQTNVVGVILIMIGTMLMLALGGDHYLLYSLRESFNVLSPGHLVITRSLIVDLLKMMTDAFVLGFKLASPAVVVLLSIDITLGIIGKTTSKMQIFFVGLPLKISIGLFIITVVIGFMKALWGSNIVSLSDTLGNLFKLMRI